MENEGDVVRHRSLRDGGSGAVVAHDLTDNLTVAILSNCGEQHIGTFLDGVLSAIGSETG